MEEVNYFDVVVLVLVLLLGLKGLIRGFIKEAFALIGIVLGVYIASKYAFEVGELISSNIIPIESDNVILLSGFIITIVIVWAFIYVFGTIVSRIFSLSGLGIFDRILGFLFGAGKIFSIFAIIVFAVSKVGFLEKNLENITANSIMYPMLIGAGELIIKIDPIKIKDEITQTIDTTKANIEDITKKE